MSQIFERALSSLRSVTVRPDISLNEIQAPSDLAPFSVAYSIEVLPESHSTDSEFGAGRFVLLYDPEFNESWKGNFRAIMYSHAPLEVEIGADPFLATVTWSWLIDSLAAQGAEYIEEAGTATKMISRGFGSLAEHGEGAKIELRASWTPLRAEQAGLHLESCLSVVALLAGLPPSSDAESFTIHRLRKNRQG